jgi:hypothetical protein
MEDDGSAPEETVYPPPLTRDQKFCMDCGKVILRRAEICPACGCRQAPAPHQNSSNFPSSSSWPVSRSPELQSSFVTKMATLILLNVLWNGLGNLAIGDKRGWTYGFFNWIVFALSFVTVGIPSLLFFAYCGYAGYQFLLAQK